MKLLNLYVLVLWMRHTQLLQNKQRIYQNTRNKVHTYAQIHTYMHTQLDLPVRTHALTHARTKSHSSCWHIKNFKKIDNKIIFISRCFGICNIYNKLLPLEEVVEFSNTQKRGVKADIVASLKQ